jgi:hypothetical protein
VGDQRHAPAASPRERPGTHYIGGWVGFTASLDGCGKLSPPGFDPQTVQPVAISYTDYALPAHRGTAVLILNLGARTGERSVSAPGLFFLDENPQHPPNRGLGPHSRSRRFREQLENSTTEGE